MIACLFGCGSTKQRVATDQLLISSAVDSAVHEIDFSALSGQTVYFDTQFIKDSKANRSEVGDAASGYVISALRQQMAIAGCLLEDSPEAAEFIIEARVGALGADASEVVYGVPASNFLGAAVSAASMVSPMQVPAAPTIPEIAVARKDNRRAAAKIVAYAYHRPTRRVVWQSGQSHAESTAQDRWVMGAGPFQQGSIYDGTQFASGDLPNLQPPVMASHEPVASTSVRPRLFVEPAELVDPPKPDDDAVIQAGFSEDVMSGTNPLREIDRDESAADDEALQ